MNYERFYGPWKEATVFTTNNGIRWFVRPGHPLAYVLNTLFKAGR